MHYICTLFAFCNSLNSTENCLNLVDVLGNSIGSTSKKLFLAERLELFLDFFRKGEGNEA